MSRKGIGGHQTTEGKNDEWLTPPYVIKSLGEFTLDPCSPIVRPAGFDTADHYYNIQDNGLLKEWFGRVWLNPPYNRYEIEYWLQKMALHGNGISLLFARTETVPFQKYVFGGADSILYLAGRLTFYDVNGNKASANGGAPSVLCAYGKHNVEVLQYVSTTSLPGHHSLINYTPVIVVGISRTWRTVITICLEKNNGKADLATIYKTVERIAPEKTRRSSTYKEKIRQQLQYHFTKIKRGEYSL